MLHKMAKFLIKNQCEFKFTKEKEIIILSRDLSSTDIGTVILEKEAKKNNLSIKEEHDCVDYFVIS